MKASGVLLVGIGVWVLCQVLGGNALTRLNISGDSSSSSTSSSSSPSTAPGTTPAPGSGGVIGSGTV